MVYRAMAGAEGRYDSGILFVLFSGFVKCKVLRREHDEFVLRAKAVNDKGRLRYVLFRATPNQLAELLEPLMFVFEPGQVPVRLESWKGARAVNASLHGVSFGDYLQLENLYQGFLSTISASGLLVERKP